MPRQQGGGVVEGGGQLKEMIARQQGYQQQRYLAAMQEQGRTRSAAISAGAQAATARAGARSREKVAQVQAGTTKEIAAMQQSAEDERAAERILDAQKAREMQMTLEKFRQKLEDDRIENQRQYDEKQRVERLGEAAAVEEKEDWIGMNQELLDRLSAQINQKIAVTAGAQRITSRQDLAAFQTSLHDVSRHYLGERDAVDTVDQLVTDALDSSPVFTHLSERSAELMKDERYKGVRVGWPVTWEIGKWSQAEIAADEAQAVSKLVWELENEITQIVGKRTNNRMGVGGQPGTLAKGLRSKQIGYGELYHGLAAFKSIQRNIREEITAISADPKSEEAGKERATIKAYRRVLSDINRVVSEARSVRNDKSNPQLQTMVADAMGVVAGTGLGERLRGVKRPEDIDVKALVETLRDGVAGLGQITFLGPEELQKRYQSKVKYKLGNIDELTTLLLQELGREGGYGGTISDEMEEMFKAIAGGTK